MEMSKEHLPIAEERKGGKKSQSTKYINNESIEILFGIRIHEMRIQQRLPLDVLAHAAQIHRNYLSDIERGKRNVSLRVIDNLAKALGVEIAELFS